MSIQHIDGFWMQKMLASALASLKEHEREVNDMNVFPVPDGDTGTNMYLTLQGAFTSTASETHLGRYIGRLSEAALMNARGNSGVILSQLLSGFAESLKRCSIANARECSAAMISAYKKAYAAVDRPVEGTILTVARNAADNSRFGFGRNICVDGFFSVYLSELKKAQLITPELLSSLKEAGVYDSGAQGWIYIIEGFVRCLYGKDASDVVVPIEATAEDETELNAFTAPSLDAFDEKSTFELGYCMEFILQLIKTEFYVHGFSRMRFVKAISEWGNSIVCVEDAGRVKVHVHTKKPGNIISVAQHYGEFVAFKLENMDAQANAQRAKAQSLNAERDASGESRPAHKDLAFVSVADGEGFEILMKEAGADIILNGGAGMNTPTGDFLKAFDRLNADKIVVLPNNPNIRHASEQAVVLSGRSDILVLPTRDQAEGLTALSMDVPNLDPEARLKLIREGIEGHRTLFATKASRASNIDGLTCRPGDHLVILDSTVLACEPTQKKALEKAFEKLGDKEDVAAVVIYSGNQTPEEHTGEVSGILEELCPDAEVVVRHGGQNVYDFLIEIQ